MIARKEKWTTEIQEKLAEKFDNNIKLIFKAKDGLNGNQYPINEKNFLMCDVIFSTPIGYFVFEFLTNENSLYRFSTGNKYFWEEDLKTGKRKKREFNWINVFKIGKEILDKTNKQYNRFFLFAKHVNFEGSAKGIYGVSETSFDSLLDKIKG